MGSVADQGMENDEPDVALADVRSAVGRLRSVSEADDREYEAFLADIAAPLARLSAIAGRPTDAEAVLRQIS